MTQIIDFTERLTRAQRLLRILQGEQARHLNDAEHCLKIAEMSARLAWQCHAGTFMLPHVETLLATHETLADNTGSSTEMLRMVAGRTLHVMSEAYAVGGHTRLVKRWIQLMGEDRHALVLVRQKSPFQPEWVLPPESEVPLIDLAKEGLNRRSRVSRLIALFKVARRVILHIHPDDAVSVAAAYRVPEADIRFLDHADHVAWLGAGLPHSFINLRERGVRLAQSRRGIDPAHCDVVPLPITPPAPVSRAEARAHFGLSESDILVLTIASAYKFKPVGNRSLRSPMDRFLARRNVKFMVVGAGPKHPLFARLAEEHPGQVFCLGNVPAPDLHRAAADIYLDSFPFASITSMLESAAVGTPIVAYQPNRLELEILYSECGWLPETLYSAPDAARVVDLLNALADDKQLRESLAERGRVGMAMYYPEAWRTAISASLARTFPARRGQPGQAQFRDDLLDQVLAGLLGDVRDLVGRSEHDDLDTLARCQIAMARTLKRL